MIGLGACIHAMAQESSSTSPAHVIELTSVTDSEILKVNLSPGRAEVTRVYELTLEAGVNQVRISGLPDRIDRDSLRVEGRGAAIIHDVSIAPTPPAAPADPETASTLFKEHKRISNKVRRCKDVSAFLEKSLRSTELTLDDYAQLSVIVQAYEDQSLRIDAQLVDLEEELENTRLSRDEAWGRAPRAQAADPFGLTATIGISAEKGGEAEIELIYGLRTKRIVFLALKRYVALQDVSWQASYDICVNMQSKDAPFTIRYKAAISQFSGEDWDNVRLTPDTFSPTFAWAWAWGMGPTVIACRSSRSSSRSRRSRSPAHQYPRHIVSDRPTPMQHATIPTPNFGGLSTTYDVPGLISVPNNGQAHIATIAKLTLDAEFSWLVVTEVDLRAHLKAQVKNVSEYALVAGPANVYIDGSFVAKSRNLRMSPRVSLPPLLLIPSRRITNQPPLILNLQSSSVDPSIRTTYTPLSKKASCSGLINKTTTTVYYRQATIRNTKPVAIQNLKILDRVPVSENAQIVVKLLSPALSPPPPPAPVSTKVEKSPSSGSSSGGGILDKAKGYQFKGLKSFGTLSSSSSSLRVSEDVFAQWEGEEEGEEGTGRDGRLSWVCTIPSQGKVSVGLRWEESRPVGMRSVEGARWWRLHCTISWIIELVRQRGAVGGYKRLHTTRI
ncbi:hypothetical protein BDN71DRAFT_1431173 [Pleurotus eryngii]|uniref:DUF4139 domain-containing protein n=1 Tax=Pleurotus eryngii TaxID=5323 RepID=A0A9P5ZY39_PLEER|nr:hypothetical protein BDN71DRAFT_1431173 [Pleurotus eryngii]